VDSVAEERLIAEGSELIALWSALTGYCEGGDLGAYLKHKKGILLREPEVLYHFVQMALALHYMHEKNILHRFVAKRLSGAAVVLRGLTLLFLTATVT
jgi:hypothetical protein